MAVEYLKASDRRSLARLAAEELLNGGMRVLDLTLRHVANHLGIPLSTLTYVYSSTDALLDDMASDYRERWRTVLAEQPWDRGLAVELRFIADLYYERVLTSPYRVAMAEWQMYQTFRGIPYIESTGSDGGLFELIALRSGERYRVGTDVMAGIIGVIGQGVLLHSVRTSPEEARPVMDAAVESLILLADPH